MLLPKLNQKEKKGELETLKDLLDKSKKKLVLNGGITEIFLIFGW